MRLIIKYISYDYDNNILYSFIIIIWVVRSAVGFDGVDGAYFSQLFFKQIIHCPYELDRS